MDTCAYGKDTGAYGKAYDAVPQEQGNKIEVYGLRQQDPTEALTGKPSAEPTDLRRLTQVAKSVQQDIQRDYSDASPSSKISVPTHFEACEEDLEPSVMPTTKVGGPAQKMSFFKWPQNYF